MRRDFHSFRKRAYYVSATWCAHHVTNYAPAANQALDLGHGVSHIAGNARLCRFADTALLAAEAYHAAAAYAPKKFNTNGARESHASKAMVRGKFAFSVRLLARAGEFCTLTESCVS